LVKPVTRLPVDRQKDIFSFLTVSTGTTGTPKIIENLKFSIIFVDIFNGNDNRAEREV
jgi:hypothetical protein